MKRKTKIDIVRSSAAEYLTFITSTGESDVNAVYFEENVWLTQKMMGVLYNIGVNTINYHLKKIFADGEVEEEAVIRKFRITASDGKTYDTNHYNLSAIIAVGNKVDSPRAVQFRKWANGIIESYTIKGFAMDDERLENFGTILTKDYFEEQLERIRDFLNVDSIKKLLIFMLLALTMMQRRKRPNCFLPEYRISCIGQSMVKRPQRSFIIVQIVRKNTWD